jgi:hypothetical protein
MKKFQPVDLSQVTQTSRDVLAVTFSELLDLYCADRPAKRPELREYRLRKWRAQFKGLSAWDLSTAHFNAMVNALEDQGYAPPTINRDVADIASSYSWAIKRRYCPADFLSPTREFQRRPARYILAVVRVNSRGLGGAIWMCGINGRCCAKQRRACRAGLSSLLQSSKLSRRLGPNQLLTIASCSAVAIRLRLTTSERSGTDAGEMLVFRSFIFTT